MRYGNTGKGRPYRSREKRIVVPEIPHHSSRFIRGYPLAVALGGSTGLQVEPIQKLACLSQHLIAIGIKYNKLIPEIGMATIIFYKDIALPLKSHTTSPTPRGAFLPPFAAPQFAKKFSRLLRGWLVYAHPSEGRKSQSLKGLHRIIANPATPASISIIEFGSGILATRNPTL